MYPAKLDPALDPADCWILSSYLNAGSSVFRKTMNYMPKITEYVSKIVQTLYSTDAALLRIDYASYLIIACTTQRSRYASFVQFTRPL